MTEPLPLQLHSAFRLTSTQSLMLHPLAVGIALLGSEGLTIRERMTYLDRGMSPHLCYHQMDVASELLQISTMQTRSRLFAAQHPCTFEGIRTPHIRLRGPAIASRPRTPTDIGFSIMPATRPRPSHRQARSGIYTAIAVAAIIISLAAAALLLCLWDRHRKRGAKLGLAINVQSYNRAASHPLHPAKDMDGLETGVVRGGTLKSPPRYQEQMQRT